MARACSCTVMPSTCGNLSILAKSENKLYPNYRENVETQGADDAVRERRCTCKLSAQQGHHLGSVCVHVFVNPVFVKTLTFTSQVLHQLGQISNPLITLWLLPANTLSITLTQPAL